MYNIFLRNAVDTVKPAYTPLAQLRVNPQQNLTKNLPLPPIPKTNLTVEKSVSRFSLYLFKMVL